MVGLLRRMYDAFDNLFYGKMVVSFPEGEPVLNVSEDTLRWNRAALDTVLPENYEPFKRTFTGEEMRQIQEQTYRDNARALALS